MHYMLVFLYKYKVSHNNIFVNLLTMHKCKTNIPESIQMHKCINNIRLHDKNH